MAGLTLLFVTLSMSFVNIKTFHETMFIRETVDV